MMYCRSCGNSLNNGENYCRHCGSRVVSNVNYQNNMNNQGNQKKKLSGWAIFAIIAIPLTIIGIIIAFMVFVFSIVFGVLEEAQTEPYIELGNESIPSIYNVIGERELCSVSTDNGISDYYAEYEYCDDYLNIDEYNEYLDYLIEEEGFIEKNSYYYRSVIKESNYSGMILEVEIDLANDIIYYRRKDGEVNYKQSVDDV